MRVLTIHEATKAASNVNLDRLWAPWRMQYIAAGPQPGPRDFIAAYDQATNDRENLVILRTNHTIVILNRFPYNNGHLLIAPRRAVAELRDLSDAELLDSQQVLCRCIDVLQSLMKPDGFNVGLNLGKAAGAGLPEHLHWHVVPRWNGDINFMTVCSETRVIVQSLDELWVILRKGLGQSTE
jgi:ATP adenylyltransferase